MDQSSSVKPIVFDMRCTFEGKKKCNRMACRGSVYCGIHKLKEDGGFQCKRCGVYLLAVKIASHTCKLNVIEDPLVLACTESDINLFPPMAVSSEVFPLADSAAIEAKVCETYNIRIGKLDTEFKKPIECETLFSAVKPGGEHRGERWYKHRLQEVSMVGHMMHVGLIRHTMQGNALAPLVVLEFGAGAGALSSTIGLVRPDATYACIERSAYKHKKEKCLKNCKRVRADIKDVNIFKLLEGLSENRCIDEIRDFIVVGKHLCGVATDLTLMALKNFKHENGMANLAMDVKTSTNTVDMDMVPAGRQKWRLRGVAIATCCHSSCQWSNCCGTYLPTPLSLPVPILANCHDAGGDNGPLSSDLPIPIPVSVSQVLSSAPVSHNPPCCLKSMSNSEFENVRKWSGCYVVDPQQSKLEHKMHAEATAKGQVEFCNAPYHKRAILGRQCKRVIDQGRIDFIKEHLGLEVKELIPTLSVPTLS